MSYKVRNSIFFICFTLLLVSCTGEKEADIPETLSVELVTHDVTTFQGTDGYIILNVTGGIPPYAYNWSNGEKTKDIENLPAGKYSVTVTDGVDSTATASAMIKQPIPENAIVDIEGNVYTTVKIGDQVWMQQNLRVSVAPDSTEITSYIYGDNPQNEEIYGRLYTWYDAMNGSTAESAQGICPTGWHIPSDGEWKILEMYLGMTQQEADRSNTWRGIGVGTKLGTGGESGYDALYCGRRHSGGTYSLINDYEYIWTSTESGSYAWRRCLESGVSTVGRYDSFPKTYAFSIRCVKD